VAAVEIARKLAIFIWHLLYKGESYLWARPALHAKKLRNLERTAVRGPERSGSRPQPQEPSRAGAALGRTG
jgi:hypothetical protein